MSSSVDVLTRFATDDERYRYARPTDIERIVDMLEDEEVGQWLWFVPASRKFLEDHFRPLIDAQWQSLADGKTPTVAVFIAEDSEGAFVGQGAALAVDGSAGGFEIGYQLPKAAWGRGVGSRLAWFLAAWTVHAHAAHRVQAGFLDGNVASQRILEKVGLVEEGRRPGYRLKGEARHTEVLYGAQVANLDAQRLASIAEQVGLIER